MTEGWIDLIPLRQSGGGYTAILKTDKQKTRFLLMKRGIPFHYVEFVTLHLRADRKVLWLKVATKSTLNRLKVTQRNRGGNSISAGSVPLPIGTRFRYSPAEDGGIMLTVIEEE